MTNLQFTKLDPPERKRAYYFPGGKVEIENVTAICVRQSGTHRIETASGEKYIINPGWFAIRLEVDAWTF